MFKTNEKKKQKISAKKQKVSVNNRYKEEANGNSELKNTITKKKKKFKNNVLNRRMETVNLKTEKQKVLNLSKRRD